MLDELDKEVKGMGLKYVRYADDFSIYCQEEKEAMDVQGIIYRFLKDRLHLPINEEKSDIRNPEEFTILGSSAWPKFIGNSKSWTNGCVVAYVTVSGTVGRSRSVDVKT